MESNGWRILQVSDKGYGLIMLISVLFVTERIEGSPRAVYSSRQLCEYDPGCVVMVATWNDRQKLDKKQQLYLMFSCFRLVCCHDSCGRVQAVYGATASL